MNPMKVLTVDDDWTMTKLIRMNLENEDIKVVEASNGIDCLKTLSEQGIDLVLLDLRLPDFSGWGILSLLRLTRSLRNIPVIVVSVEPPDSDLVQQFRPDDYIEKPFDVRDLVARVRKLIGERYGRRHSLINPFPEGSSL